MQSFWRTCAACKGTRKIEDKICPYCLGTGDDMSVLEVLSAFPLIRLPILTNQ